MDPVPVVQEKRRQNIVTPFPTPIFYIDTPGSHTSKYPFTMFNDAPWSTPTSFMLSRTRSSQHTRNYTGMIAVQQGHWILAPN